MLPRIANDLPKIFPTLYQTFKGTQKKLGLVPYSQGYHSLEGGRVGEAGKDHMQNYGYDHKSNRDSEKNKTRMDYTHSK